MDGPWLTGCEWCGGDHEREPLCPEAEGAAEEVDGYSSAQVVGYTPDGRVIIKRYYLDRLTRPRWCTWPYKRGGDYFWPTRIAKWK